MSAKDQMKAILSYVGMDAKPFAESLGYDRAQRIYDVLNGKTKSLSLSLRTDIRAKYPVFNETWLVSGEGDMVTGDDEYLKRLASNTVKGNGNNVNYGKDNVISFDQRLLEIIEKQQETIAKQTFQIGKFLDVIDKLSTRIQ